jgi:starvation-inducible DNA-binding protein
MEQFKTAVLEVDHLSSIGLDIEKSKELAKKLNVLLASYSIFYQNVRGYHWNLKGGNFFELHLKFEELYNMLSTKIDDIAERIVTIGYAANHNFSDYKLESKVLERIHVSNGIKASQDILNSLNIIISLQREIAHFSNEMKDDGTCVLMRDNIKVQEKLVWMYAAFLEK